MQPGDQSCLNQSVMAGGVLVWEGGGVGWRGGGVVWAPISSAGGHKFLESSGP